MVSSSGREPTCSIGLGTSRVSSPSRAGKNIVDAASRNNIPVSMCGEMAGDPQYVALLVGMGLRSISVAPAQVPQIKKLVRSLTYENARGLAESVLKAESREEVTSLLASDPGTQELAAFFRPVRHKLKSPSR